MCLKNPVIAFVRIKVKLSVMNKIRKFLHIGFITLFLGGIVAMLDHNPGQAKEPDVLTPAAASKLMQTNKADHDFTILDVRTPEEYAAGHIPGALRLDFNSPDFADKAESLPKVATYLVYCRSGARSAKAAAMLREKGFLEVLEIEGGILEWQKDGLPVVKEE